jgi:hypothetical protein
MMGMLQYRNTGDMPWKNSNFRNECTGSYHIVISCYAEQQSIMKVLTVKFRT